MKEGPSEGAAGLPAQARARCARGQWQADAACLPICSACEFTEVVCEDCQQSGREEVAPPGIMRAPERGLGGAEQGAERRAMEVGARARRFQGAMRIALMS